MIERFFGLIHDTDTNDVTLKSKIEATLANHDLSLSTLLGQGYAGASNMRGQFNGLKTLILNQNESSFYIHCFAHQLQLAFIAVAKHLLQMELMFNIVSNISNVVGASAKRRDVLREKHAAKILEALESGKVNSGKRLNQELALKRPDETRWSSHYYALLNLIFMYSSVVEVLEIIETSAVAEKRVEALSIIVLIRAFEFVFCVHLMNDILGLTFELSQGLQKKDQDIVNAIELVQI